MLLPKKNKDFSHSSFFGVIGNCFKDRCIREAILESNGTLTSDNSRYKLKLKENGELDIYCASQYIWSSNTAGSNATKLHFQNDGNLVLYTESGSTVWETDTNTEYGYVPEKVDKVVLQDNGNLVMSFPNNDVKWTSGSNLVCQNGECCSFFTLRITHFYISIVFSKISFSAYFSLILCLHLCLAK